MTDRAYESLRAVPGLAPDDDRGREVAVLVVDGERFRVWERQTGRRHTYAYDWLSGPNPGYGFASSGRFVSTDADHIEAIRSFLAQIDPATGFIGPD